MSGGLRRGRTLRRPRCQQRGAVLRQHPADQPVAGTVTGPLFCSGGDQLDQTLVKTADHLAPALDYGPPVHHFPGTVLQRPCRRPSGLPVGHPVPGQVPVDVRSRGLRISPEVDFTEAPFSSGRPRATTGRAASAFRWSAPPGIPPPGRRGPAVAAPSGDCRRLRPASSRQ